MTPNSQNVPRLTKNFFAVVFLRGMLEKGVLVDMDIKAVKLPENLFTSYAMSIFSTR